MLKTNRFLATAIALVAMTLAGLATSSVASAASSITGVVYINSERQAGATVYLLKPNSAGYAVRTGVTTKTNSAGRYTFSGLTDNRWFAIEAAKTIGRCFVGTGVTTYRGFGTHWINTAGAAYGSNVRMGYDGHVAC